LKPREAKQEAPAEAEKEKEKEKEKGAPLRWSGINRVIVAGVVGRNPTIVKFPTGYSIANLIIATNDGFVDDAGQAKQLTEWHKVSVRQKNIVEFIEQNVGVGARVYVEGRLRTRKAKDSLGNDKFLTEIIVSLKGGQFTVLKPSARPSEPVVVALKDKDATNVGLDE